MKRMLIAGLALSLSLVLSASALPPPETGQTKVKPGTNFFSIEQDIQLGRQAAAQVEQQMPMVNDGLVQEWIEGLGQRLASYTTMPNLPWRFRVTNSSEINAFALPGGFVYVNRGLIDITNDESELAGVLGHEMAHVTLRHGTNQLSKSMLYQTPLAILGSLGGAAGALGQLGNVGLSVAFLKFSRDAEKQADVVGTQTMVKAGYDPRGMVSIFQKLERQGAGKGTPGFLSSHPSPENRIQRIQKEISLIQAPPNPVRSSDLYLRARNRLRGMGPAPRLAPGSNSDSRQPTQPSRSRSRRPGEMPSRSLETYRAGDGSFEVGYPSNWEALSQTATGVTLAPEWATEGNEVTHGAIVSILNLGPDNRGSIRTDQALDAIVNQLRESNPNLFEERSSRYDGQLDGRRAMATYLSGRNSLGNDERVWLIARPGERGIVYLLFVAPERDFDRYEPTFRSMVQSFRFNDR
jgi:Zn-dependent protease with chaperone function